MTYLTCEQLSELGGLLKTFFRLPYSTDLDGKDVETLLRIVKGANGPRSKRKELFDIIDGNIGYSVKTLFKPPHATRVDLQEQRFCDVEEVRRLRAEGRDSAMAQGEILLRYMHSRIRLQMEERGIAVAKSLILLKHWNSQRSVFSFAYWEEDFLGYVETLMRRHAAREIEWIEQGAGLHARDLLRREPRRGGTTGVLEPVRLLRMHYKHNQIFTDHDIPANCDRISFECLQLSWNELSGILAATQDQ